MTGAGETLLCFTTVLEGDALLKEKLLFNLTVKLLLWLQTSRRYNSDKWFIWYDCLAWKYYKRVQSSVQVANRYLRELL